MVEPLIPVVWFVGSLGVLLVASDAFTSAAEQIGLAFGISPFIIGVTIVAGGTSLPELTASLLERSSLTREGDQHRPTVVGSTAQTL
ncbi:hypothetical protein [Haloarcula sp. JP-L23]|uniref:hypothetical protein n=1 Tax=Haloarcula sp. JP-L23 TaxID=2716717 RepID=UPI00140F35CB|nr:hypothetical protein G9465_20465 [Haloarcula sp. JP-L23]